MLQQLPKDATSYERLSRSDAIHDLEAENGLTDLLLRWAEVEHGVLRHRDTRYVRYAVFFL